MNTHPTARLCLALLVSSFLCTATSGICGSSAHAQGAALGALDLDAAHLHGSPPTPDEVLYQSKLSELTPGFGALELGGQFGSSVANIGDIDGDGITDVAIGALSEDLGGPERGAFYIVFMNRDGTAKSRQRVGSSGVGGFMGLLNDGDNFGTSFAAIGDRDDDGITDLAVGARFDGATDQGAVWILYLNADGTVKDTHVKIPGGGSGFTGTLSDNDNFGQSVCYIPELNALAVGTRDNDGAPSSGAVWLLFLNSNGTVSSHYKISAITPVLNHGPIPLLGDDYFGSAIADLGDLDQEGTSVVTLAVGAQGDNTGGGDTGAVWLVFLHADGQVFSYNRIAEGESGFPGDIMPNDIFGCSLGRIDGLDPSADTSLAVGAWGTSGMTGAIWVLSIDVTTDALASTGLVTATGFITEGSQGFSGDLDVGDEFGAVMASLGDLDGDGRTDLLVGAPLDDDGGAEKGAAWICFMNDGTLALGANAVTWTGATSTQWELGSNWSTGTVPDSTNTVIIPDKDTTPNDPEISVSGQECASLWVQLDGTLAISGGLDSLGVNAGATVSGTITGTGELVFDAPGVLAGNSSITLPLVRATDALTQQGGPFTITGTLQGDTSIALEGDLSIIGSLIVGDLLSGTMTSSLNIAGGGADEVRLGQVCLTGVVISNLPLQVDGAGTGLVLELSNGWPLNVLLSVGEITLLTSTFSVGGDLILQEGALFVGANGSITANGMNGIVIEDGATLDITSFQTLVPAPTPIAVQSGGKLNIGAGGELLLQSNTLTIENGGTLCLDGVPSNRAGLSGHSGNRYTLALLPGSTLAAKGFLFQGMSGSGIVIDPMVNIAVAPYDLRAGLFDDPAPAGALLDIERALPTTFRYLRFENTTGSSGAFNVRTTGTGAPLRMVNWSGSFAGEPFEDDPGAGEPGLIEWAPPEESDVQDFTAHWGSNHVKVRWQTQSEVDSAGFLVQRSPDPAGTYMELVTKSPQGPSPYAHDDYTVQAQTGYRYSLVELLTHGDQRTIGEVVLPSSSAPNILLPKWGVPAPPMPPADLTLVIGHGSGHPDVPSAVHALLERGQRDPMTFELLAGTHVAFELGPELVFDLRLVARPGASIDASQTPLRVHDLGPDRVLEFEGLVIDSRGEAHPAMELKRDRGVVLFQDTVLRGSSVGPVLTLSHSDCMALQGGAIEGELTLDQSSRATANDVAIACSTLTGSSTLETRGSKPAVSAELGSSHRSRPSAPRLTITDGSALLESEPGTVAELFAAPALGYHVRDGIEGAILLERATLTRRGSTLPLPLGKARWRLGALSAGEVTRLQALVLDPASGRTALSNVVRVDARR